MATRQYDLAKADEYSQVTAGAGSAISEDVSLTVQSTMTIEEVILALKKLEMYITQFGVA